MRIKKITSQTRRDFVAEYECEHCGDTVNKRGYDDTNFHQNVVPGMKCEKCGEKSPETYRALAPKYPASTVI